MARRRRRHNYRSPLDLQCPVCYDDVMIRPTVLVPCAHMVCAQCLSAFRQPRCMLCSAHIETTVVPIELRKFTEMLRTSSLQEPPQQQPKIAAAAAAAILPQPPRFFGLMRLLFGIVWEYMPWLFLVYAANNVLGVLYLKGNHNFSPRLAHEFMKAMADATFFLLVAPLYSCLDVLFCFPVNSTIPCLFYNDTLIGNTVEAARNLTIRVLVEAFPNVTM